MENNSFIDQLKDYFSDNPKKKTKEKWERIHSNFGYGPSYDQFEHLMNTLTILNIKDYSENPGPRYCSQGNYSGEDYYHKVLNDKFYETYKNHKMLIVDLDGTSGYKPPFLDEIFGNLVYDFGIDQVESILKIKSNDEPAWNNMIYGNTFRKWEAFRKAEIYPKITINHKDWFYINDNKIYKKNLPLK